jgi:hypothetical protein
MKKLILAVAAVMVSVAAFAQGQITFNNRVAGVVDARVTFASDGPGVGAGYTAQLWGGPEGTAPAALTLLNPTTTFRTSSAAAQGYVTPTDVTVPGIASGSKAAIQMRVVDAAGTTVGESLPITLTLGGGLSVPANLEGLQAFTVTAGGGGPIIPEPSTIALAALGIGALLLRRRK